MFTQGLYFTRGIILQPLVSTAWVQILHRLLQILKKKKHKHTEFIAYLSFVSSFFQSFHYSLP